MIRCPVCNSRKIRGNRKVGFFCRNCRYRNLPRSTSHSAKCDGGITDSQEPSQTITNSPLYNTIHDLHNNAYKFRVLKFQEPDLPRQKGFDGRKWDFEGGYLTPNWLVIYNEGRNKVPLKDLPSVADTIVQGIINKAKEMAMKYDLTIDETPLPFSSNRPEIKTPYLSANNFIEKEAKAVYPLPSPIELVGKNSIQNAWNLTETLSNLTRLTELEIENKKRHQEVLEQMSQTLAKIEQSQRHESIFSKLKHNLLNTHIFK